MPRKDNLEVRGARDRVLDLLRSVGKTAPMRDVVVVQDNLVVPITEQASVRIEPGQTDVGYKLRNRDGSPAEPGARGVIGTGEQTTLVTPEVLADVTYRVLATKVVPNRRDVYLHDRAPIRVGLDTSLRARILAMLLEPTGLDDPPDSAPRVTDYAVAVRVAVDSTQVGVDYELVTTQDEGATWEVVSTDSVRGDGAPIVLDALPVMEDIELRVRASRRFDPAENREDQVAFLDVVMPLAVRPNPALAVSAVVPIVDYTAAATVVVRETQPGVTYQLYARELAWNDFWYGDDDEPGLTIAISVPDEPDVHVRRPRLDDVGDPVPQGLDAIGSSQPGTAGDVTFDLGSLDDDTVVVAVATKEHGTASSVVQLERATAVLIRPDPERAMSLSAPIRDGRLIGPMRVGDGQPGVLYHFREASASAARHLPAYFPEPDEGSVAERGIGLTHIGVDFVIARDALTQDPIIDLASALALPVSFHVRAVKARTRVSAQMMWTADIAADPPVQLEQADIVTGTRARVLVAGSRVGEQYQPFVDDQPIRNLRNGNGDDLVFRTEPLTGDTTIVLRATATDVNSGWAIERLIELGANVWPTVVARVVASPLDSASTSPTSARIVDYRATPSVEIAQSSTGVRYRVVDVAGEAARVVSTRPVTGTGGPVEVKLRALLDDAVLRIRVTRAIPGPDGIETRDLVLAPTLDVAVRADPGRRLTVGSGVVDHMAEAELTVVESQLHTEYRVLARPLSDGELFPLPDEETIAVARGEDGVVIRSPWSGIADDKLLPAGFESAGTPSQGTGDDLVLPIGLIANDVAILVTATKDHAGRTSTVALRQASALFVRPDPDPLVELRAYVSGGHIDSVQLSGGQPRVLYRVRNGRGGVEHDLPAYFHGRIDGRNRGIDDLRVGMDLIPARDSGGDGLTAPLDPLVALSRRPALDATLHLRAIDVRSGLTVQLDRTAAVPALPQIELVDAPVAPGVPAHVMIRSSTTGERYELRDDGVVSGEPTVGDGSDLELVTEPLDADALLQVFVSRPDGLGLPVERVLTLQDPVG